MRLAVDTNAYVAFCKGDSQIVETLQRAEAIFLPFIVVGELRAGFFSGSRSVKNEGLLTHFLQSPRVEVLYANDQTTHHYARLFHQLKRQGTPIPTNDLWIAALVAQHNLYLVTHDTHFDNFPQIPRG